MENKGGSSDEVQSGNVNNNNSGSDRPRPLRLGERSPLPRRLMSGKLVANRMDDSSWIQSPAGVQGEADVARFRERTNPKRLSTGSGDSGWIKSGGAVGSGRRSASLSTSVDDPWLRSPMRGRRSTGESWISPPSTPSTTGSTDTPPGSTLHLAGSALHKVTVAHRRSSPSPGRLRINAGDAQSWIKMDVKEARSSRTLIPEPIRTGAPDLHREAKLRPSDIGDVQLKRRSFEQGMFQLDSPRDSGRGRESRAKTRDEGYAVRREVSVGKLQDMRALFDGGRSKGAGGRDREDTTERKLEVGKTRGEVERRVKGEDVRTRKDKLNGTGRSEGSLRDKEQKGRVGMEDEKPRTRVGKVDIEQKVESKVDRVEEQGVAGEGLVTEVVTRSVIRRRRRQLAAEEEEQGSKSLKGRATKEKEGEETVVVSGREAEVLDTAGVVQDILSEGDAGGEARVSRPLRISSGEEVGVSDPVDIVQEGKTGVSESVVRRRRRQLAAEEEEQSSKSLKGGVSKRREESVVIQGEETGALDTAGLLKEVVPEGDAGVLQGDEARVSHLVRVSSGEETGVSDPVAVVQEGKTEVSDTTWSVQREKARVSHRMRVISGEEAGVSHHEEGIQGKEAEVPDSTGVVPSSAEAVEGDTGRGQSEERHGPNVTTHDEGVISRRPAENSEGEIQTVTRRRQRRHVTSDAGDLSMGSKTEHLTTETTRENEGIEPTEDVLDLGLEARRRRRRRREVSSGSEGPTSPSPEDPTSPDKVLLRTGTTRPLVTEGASDTLVAGRRRRWDRTQGPGDQGEGVHEGGTLVKDTEGQGQEDEGQVVGAEGDIAPPKRRRRTRNSTPELEATTDREQTPVERVHRGQTDSPVMTSGDLTSETVTSEESPVDRGQDGDTRDSMVTSATMTLATVTSEKGAVTSDLMTSEKTPVERGQDSHEEDQIVTSGTVTSEDTLVDRGQEGETGDSMVMSTTMTLTTVTSEKEAVTSDPMISEETAVERGQEDHKEDPIVTSGTTTSKIVTSEEAQMDMGQESETGDLVVTSTTMTLMTVTSEKEAVMSDLMTSEETPVEEGQGDHTEDSIVTSETVTSEKTPVNRGQEGDTGDLIVTSATMTLATVTSEKEAVMSEGDPITSEENPVEEGQEGHTENPIVTSVMEEEGIVTSEEDPTTSEDSSDHMRQQHDTGDSIVTSATLMLSTVTSANVMSEKDPMTSEEILVNRGQEVNIDDPFETPAIVTSEKEDVTSEKDSMMPEHAPVDRGRESDTENPIVTSEAVMPVIVTSEKEAMTLEIPVNRRQEADTEDLIVASEEDFMTSEDQDTTSENMALTSPGKAAGTSEKTWAVDQEEPGGGTLTDTSSSEEGDATWEYETLREETPTTAEEQTWAREEMPTFQAQFGSDVGGSVTKPDDALVGGHEGTGVVTSGEEVTLGTMRPSEGDVAESEAQSSSLELTSTECDTATEISHHEGPAVVTREEALITNNTEEAIGKASSARIKLITLRQVETTAGAGEDTTAGEGFSEDGKIQQGEEVALEENEVVKDIVESRSEGTESPGGGADSMGGQGDLTLENDKNTEWNVTGFVQDVLDSAISGFEDIKTGQREKENEELAQAEEEAQKEEEKGEEEEEEEEEQMKEGDGEEEEREEEEEELGQAEVELGQVEEEEEEEIGQAKEAQDEEGEEEREDFRQVEGEAQEEEMELQNRGKAELGQLNVSQTTDLQEEEPVMTDALTSTVSDIVDDIMADTMTDLLSRQVTGEVTEADGSTVTSMRTVDLSQGQSDLSSGQDEGQTSLKISDVTVTESIDRGEPSENLSQPETIDREDPGMTATVSNIADTIMADAMTEALSHNVTTYQTSQHFDQSEGQTDLTSAQSEGQIESQTDLTHDPSEGQRDLTPEHSEGQTSLTMEKSEGQTSLTLDNAGDQSGLPTDEPSLGEGPLDVQEPVPTSHSLHEQEESVVTLTPCTTQPLSPSLDNTSGDNQSDGVTNGSYRGDTYFTDDITDLAGEVTSGSPGGAINGGISGEQGEINRQVGHWEGSVGGQVCGASGEVGQGDRGEGESEGEGGGEGDGVTEINQIKEIELNNSPEEVNGDQGVDSDSSGTGDDWEGEGGEPNQETREQFHRCLVTAFSTEEISESQEKVQSSKCIGESFSMSEEPRQDDQALVDRPEVVDTQHTESTGREINIDNIIVEVKQITEGVKNLETGDNKDGDQSIEGWEHVSTEGLVQNTEGLEQEDTGNVTEGFIQSIEEQEQAMKGDIRNEVKLGLTTESAEGYICSEEEEGLVTGSAEGYICSEEESLVKGSAEGYTFSGETVPLKENEEEENTETVALGTLSEAALDGGVRARQEECVSPRHLTSERVHRHDMDDVIDGLCSEQVPDNLQLKNITEIPHTEKDTENVDTENVADSLHTESNEENVVESLLIGKDAGNLQSENVIGGLQLETVKENLQKELVVESGEATGECEAGGPSMVADIGETAPAADRSVVMAHEGARMDSNANLLLGSEGQSDQRPELIDCLQPVETQGLIMVDQTEGVESTMVYQTQGAGLTTEDQAAGAILQLENGDHGDSGSTSSTDVCDDNQSPLDNSSDDQQDVTEAVEQSSEGREDYYYKEVLSETVGLSEGQLIDGETSVMTQDRNNNQAEATETEASEEVVTVPLEGDMKTGDEVTEDRVLEEEGSVENTGAELSEVCKISEAEVSEDLVQEEQGAIEKTGAEDSEAQIAITKSRAEISEDQVLDDQSFRIKSEAEVSEDLVPEFQGVVAKTGAEISEAQSAMTKSRAEISDDLLLEDQKTIKSGDEVSEDLVPEVQGVVSKTGAEVSEAQIAMTKSRAEVSDELILEDQGAITKTRAEVSVDRGTMVQIVEWLSSPYYRRADQHGPSMLNGNGEVSYADLILEVFEESESLFFPLQSQKEARAFIKALHMKGVDYQALCQEIGEHEHNFTSWRKSLGRAGIGHNVMHWVNSPLQDLLDDGSEDEDDGMDEADGHAADQERRRQEEERLREAEGQRRLQPEEPETTAKKALDFNKNDQKDAHHTASTTTTSSSSSRAGQENGVPASTRGEVVKREKSPPPTTTDKDAPQPKQKYEQEPDPIRMRRLQEFKKEQEKGAEGETTVKDIRKRISLFESSSSSPSKSGSESPRDGSESGEPEEEEANKMESLSSGSGSDHQSSPEPEESESSRDSPPPDVTASERKASEKVTTETDQGPALTSSSNGREASPEETPKSPPPAADKKQEANLPDVNENYNSDLDVDNDLHSPIQAIAARKIAEAQATAKTGSGFLYVFSDTPANSPTCRVKVGASTFPHKRLRQAQLFNPGIYQVHTVAVKQRSAALSQVLEQLEQYRLPNQKDWFEGPFNDILAAMSDVAARYPSSRKIISSDDVDEESAC